MNTKRLPGMLLMLLAIVPVAAAHPRQDYKRHDYKMMETVTGDGIEVGERIVVTARRVKGGDSGGAAQQPPAGEVANIDSWLKGYDAAFNAKDLDRLANYYHPDVTVFEGGGIDNGWAAYRDHHLGPELKQFENLQFSHTDAKVTPLAGGTAAYATARYSLKAQFGDRAVDSTGLATYVLVKGADGAWKIRHSHTSSRPRRPAQ